MKTCILIPTYNEEAAIGGLVMALKPYALDVFVSDDGSADQTVACAQKSGAHVLKHAQRTGKGATLIRGFHHVMNLGYNGIIMMDGDGQHAPTDIPQFLEAIAKNPKCILVGNRLHDPKNMPRSRLWTNRMMSAIISAGCGQKIPDTQSGFRYVHVDILNALNIQSRAYEIETELLMKASKKGYVINSVPIQTIYGDEKSKINPIADGMRFIKYYFKEIFTPRS